MVLQFFLFSYTLKFFNLAGELIHIFLRIALRS